jgi:DNA repair protein RadC
MKTRPPANGRYVWEYFLTRRKVMEMRESDRAGTPADIAKFLSAIGIQEEEQERFLTILLDTKHRIRGFFTVTIGLIDRSQVHAREVFRNAILQGASRVILAHNHPSGDPTPSKQDLDCTKSLVSAGKIIGIEVLDHVIIGQARQPLARDYLSFREEGLL